MPIRGLRELKRFVAYGTKARDLVFDWLTIIDDCRVLYDFGSANGQEGLFAQDRHDCKTVFVEIFPPSIEDLLKGVALRLRGGAANERFEIVAAGGDASEGHSRVLLHNPPIAGGTYNSFGDPAEYCRGGRQNEPVFGSVWMPAVTIDGMQERLGLPAPTHVKIDVDGLEDRVIAGAGRTLIRRSVRSWMVEVSPGREEAIRRAMEASNYVEIATHEHYPGKNDCWDRLYVRDDLVADYRGRLNAKWLL